tara:strand:- start:772 stop:2103 length:1332 start_codon:yes stop_codon:yes gene_type:complete
MTIKKRYRDKKGNYLHKKAKKYIPGGNSLLSKRREMFAPDIWPSFFDSAKGIKVKDLSGNYYKDFSHFAVGTNSLGYGNKQVDYAVKNCIQKGNMSTLNPPEEVLLAEKLVKMHPWSSMARFARTGGEANSIAIRIARAFTKKSVIAFCGYHGWHDWYLSANLRDKKNLDKQLLSGLSTSGVPRELESTSIPFFEGELNKLEHILKTKKVAAIKMEVMRSKKPSKKYLKDIRYLANKYNSLLIFDECTSGFRESFGGLHLNYNINPDILVLGKALGNGYAITSVIGKKEIMDFSQSTFISSTFFTERIGFVAALETLKEMKKIRSWEKISSTGLSFKNLLSSLFKKYDLNLKISGMDALVSYNLEHNEAIEAKTFMSQEMLKYGFLSSNLFYPSTAHKEDDLKEFFYYLEKVVIKIKEIKEKKAKLADYLDGPKSHTTFQRLN